ncbi:MAG: 16S rRNA (adenine(1518)-N(6)/adenine(1519)-N(6))-dimethyltransferase, partial [Clostridia bacterium]|nr:16S rRNA (adenine(1518)-N(6)/adenine(1519)-N(6))-dimethyltransferase [Clostridia bacterium]
MEIKQVLQANNFRFNKKFGQNFISDTNLLNAIVSDAEITKDDVVIEIGPGAGSLTYAIAQQAKKVVAFEIDTNLEPVLKTTLLGVNNVQVVFKDVMDVD